MQNAASPLVVMALGVSFGLTVACSDNSSVEEPGGSSVFGPGDRPSASPEPTEETPGTPSASVIPTVSAEPSASATVAPTESASPSPSVSASPTASATPTSRPRVEPSYDYGINLAGWVLQPGEEGTRCVDIRLPNEGPLLAGAIRTTLGEGSHHLIVYRSEVTEERTNPYRCTPFLDTLRADTVPLAITQIRDETIEFPPGVAIELVPGQMIRLEAHFINYTFEPLEALGTVEFGVLPEDSVDHLADFLFYGDPFISIPAFSEATVGPSFITVPEGLKVFALTAHTHQHGTDFLVEKASGRTGPGTPIYDYDEWDWEEPPVARYEPVLEFGPGEGLRFTCNYLNTSDERVSFGEGANDEMCFLWAYYYPSDGYKLCIAAAGREVCCPGDLLCNLVGGN